MACPLLRMIKIVTIGQFPPDLLTIGLNIQNQTRSQLNKGPRSTGSCPWTTGLGPRSTWLDPTTTGLGPRSTGFGSKSCRTA